MTKKITVISGFGQEPKALQNVFTNKDTIGLNYLETKNFEDLLTRDLKPYDNEVVIGWSLGGQVAVRLIEKQILKPKLLILIATPFQFVQDKETFKQFEYVLDENPEQAMAYLANLSTYNDNNPEDVLKNMASIENTDNLYSWLKELEFSCFDVDFKDFPKTIYIWGEGDAVVNNHQRYTLQYKYFANKISDFKVEIIKNCGHAPHFSHKEDFLNIINEKI